MLVYTGDFERLKEFGFEYSKQLHNNHGLEKYSFSGYYKKHLNDVQYYTFIDESNGNFEGTVFDIDTLYDLIVAGLVKKVEEK